MDFSLVVLFGIGLAFIAVVLIWLLLAAKLTRRIKARPTKESSKNNYLNVFGHKIFYTQTGAGSHVLLIHGIGASHYVWRFVVPLLAENFTVTTIDLLGFGRSEKPTTFNYDLDSQCDTIIEVLKQLGIKKSYVVGSSMGGTIAFRLAQLHPDIFPKVATLSPAADPKIAFVDLNKLLFLSPLVRPLVTEQLVKQIMKRIYSNPSLITPESLKVYSEPFATQTGGVESFAKSFKLLRDPRVYQQLDEIKVPALILWGANDKIIPVKFAEKIVAKLPEATLEVHSTAGHHIQEEDPEWAYEKILGFLKTK